MVKIALAQLSMKKSLAENLEKALLIIEKASLGGADLVIFPEIFLSPFFPQHKDSDASPFLLSLESPAIKRLQEASRKNKINCIPNVYLSEEGANYDASLMINRDGKILGNSKMVHIPQFPGFYEQTYYTPSREGFRVFQTDIGRVGIVVCFDRHFPESFRACVLKGADLIVVPTVNQKGEPEEIFEWELRVAAFQNSVAIAMCNRVGVEGKAHYYGKSILVGPEGEVVRRADETENIFFGVFDPGCIQKIRKQNPYLKLFDPAVFRLKSGYY